MAVTRDLIVPFEQSVVSLGAAAAIRIGALDIVLASKRAQTFHPDVFRNLGIDLTTRKIVVVKSASHFHAGIRAACKGHHLRELWWTLSTGSREDTLHQDPRPIVPLDEAAEFRIR